MVDKYNVFWFRRDLRLDDNAGLYHALKQDLPIRCIFIFDQNILEKIEDKTDARVTFIFDQIRLLKSKLRDLGSDLDVLHGRPLDVFSKMARSAKINAVYTNRDYENYASQRDSSVKEILQDRSIQFYSFKDHVVFEKDEVVKDDGLPYVVFTPYKKRWLDALTSKRDWDDTSQSFFLKSYPCNRYFNNFLRYATDHEVQLDELGFERSEISIPPPSVAQSLIRSYTESRDYPAIPGTSKLGIHFRFGTISIREKARKAQKINETYLSELIWRDFYSMILQHFPHVEGKPFREKYERVEWREDEEDFVKWCKGQTGYPIVDAGMRELNATGFMHNRVRMIVASFLTKHLLIDWRWGEQYFADKLLDFDLASNNGGWQWAAGCGTDAAPYFRIFNPYTQAKKFDPSQDYVKKWVPEFRTPQYIEPMVDHKYARERCLASYKKALA